MTSEKRQVQIDKVKELNKNSTKKEQPTKKTLFDKTTINSLTS